MYAYWVDKLMAVQRLDTARTTSLPVMDAADAMARWGSQLGVDGAETLERWDDKEAIQSTPGPPPLKAGDRLSVYWTELREWYAGTFTSSRIGEADDGGKQRESRVVYDATGAWARCTPAELTYWHCLDDEQWRPLTERHKEA